MPTRLANAAANSIWNLSSIFSPLPRASRAQTFTRCTACLFSTTPELLAKHGRKKKPRKRLGFLEPYRAAQSRQRRIANIARQSTLQTERKAALGDPIRTRSAPFADTIRSQPVAETLQSHLNHYLKPNDLEASLAYSKWLTEPLPNPTAATVDPAVEAQRKETHQSEHQNAQIAMSLIASLGNSSSADRQRLNIQRCIDEFGRQNTDTFLPPKAPSVQQPSPPPGLMPSSSTSSTSAPPLEPQIPIRAGRDTGSSEVQAAILTTKINTLADQTHKKDKHNLRNMRILVHRRQKMLNYLRRKERGGPRWTNLVEKLGINEGMWRGEIVIGGGVH